MHYFIYISAGFIVFQLINALVNFLFRQKILKTETHNSELISVLIPARNEETNIAVLLDALYKVKNQNVEIIVFDDQSYDNTAQVVQAYTKIDPRVHLVQSANLPAGWLGKNHACYQLALKAKGKYFLFIDADIRLYGNILDDTVSYLKKYQLGLLSVFPKQIQISIGEKLTVPIMNYILLTLLSLIFVRISPFTSHTAANGQFMLFNAEMYKNLQPHQLFRDSPVEDIVISRFFKKKKIKIACLAGEERIECRMYNSYNEALNGFSKNIFMFFGNLPVVAFLFWFCAALGIIPFILYQEDFILVYLAVVVLIQLLYSITSKQNPLLAIIFFPIHLLFLFHVMIKGLITQKKKKYTWKGRNIY